MQASVGIASIETCPYLGQDADGLGSLQYLQVASDLAHVSLAPLDLADLSGASKRLSILAQVGNATLRINVELHELQWVALRL
jgi:hypothetical protein